MKSEIKLDENIRKSVHSSFDQGLYYINSLPSLKEKIVSKIKVYNTTDSSKKTILPDDPDCASKTKRDI